MTALLALIDKVLYLNTTYIQKARGSVAKDKVQIHLTKHNLIMCGWAWMKRTLPKEGCNPSHLKMFQTIAPILNIMVIWLRFSLSR